MLQKLSKFQSNMFYLKFFYLMPGLLECLVNSPFIHIFFSIDKNG